MTDVCHLHESRDGDINTIKDNVSKHTGQWRILIVIIGLFISVTCTFMALQYQNQKELVSLVNDMNLSFTAYMAAHQMETSEGFRRIQLLESKIDDHETRIRFIEVDSVKP